MKVYSGAAIFDGTTLHTGCVLAVNAAGRADILAEAPRPDTIPLNGGVILPGFVDLQVNGGGGVMLGDRPDVETLSTMAQAHRSLGTTAIMPTLITDTPDKTRAAVDAVDRALRENIAGIAGLHLEGPHLSVAKKGAHDAALIRPMSDDDLRILCGAADRIANVMVTVAPENCTPPQITTLARAGITVSLGHTDAVYDDCMAAFDAGATCVTHLFNAMSQMGSRSPGLVGATLAAGMSAGLIADGHHVHPASMRVALRQSEKVFLVSDAMAVAGTRVTSFTLGDRTIYRKAGRLTLADGTLAGADLDLAGAVRVLVQELGQPLDSALRRATSLPVSLLRDDMGLGHMNGRIDSLIHLDDALKGVTHLKV